MSMDTTAHDAKSPGVVEIIGQGVGSVAGGAALLMVWVFALASSMRGR